MQRFMTMEAVKSLLHHGLTAPFASPNANGTCLIRHRFMLCDIGLLKIPILMIVGTAGTIVSCLYEPSRPLRVISATKFTISTVNRKQIKIEHNIFGAELVSLSIAQRSIGRLQIQHVTAHCVSSCTCPFTHDAL